MKMNLRSLLMTYAYFIKEESVTVEQSYHQILLISDKVFIPIGGLGKTYPHAQISKNHEEHHSLNRLRTSPWCDHVTAAGSRSFK